MTYRELLKILNKLSFEQLDFDVTIQLLPDDEFFAIKMLQNNTNEETDVLDKNHPYFILNTEEEKNGDD